MKILLSWIAKVHDMVQKANSQDFSGPTLQVLENTAFDLVFLFSNDTTTTDKAKRMKTYVLENQGKFRTDRIKTRFVELRNPADYQELWEVFPQKIEDCLRPYLDRNAEILINISAGTPAMAATWIMMVGTGQLQAKILNAQINRATEESYINTINLGMYPFVAALQEQINNQLQVSQMFKSEQMKKIMRELTVLASATGKPILILGETGTGKTWLAKQFHKMTGKDESKFFKVVCGEFKAADPNIAKSALFGHARGAFTGASGSKSGYLEKADGGTLFLDEIGDIPLDVQRLLIDAVESGNFRRLNSNDLLESKFQLICATNRNIEEMLERNELSQDFYYRISIHSYEIPPLRARPFDIPVILDELMHEEFENKFEMEPEVKNRIIDELSSSSLPRNIRDIERSLHQLWLKSQQPKPHKLRVDEVIQYFKENVQPSQDDEFNRLIQQLLRIWPSTKLSKTSSLKDALINESINQIIKEGPYKKNDGSYNYNQISKFIGISNKTAEKLINKKT